MTFNDPFSQQLFMLGVMASSPLLYLLSKSITRYMLNRFMADEIINIRYFEQGRLTTTVIIKTKTDGSVAQKIKQYQERSHDRA